MKHLNRVLVAAALLMAWPVPSRAVVLDGLWRGEFAGVSAVIDGPALQLYQTSERFRVPLDAIMLDLDGGFTTDDGRRYQFETEGDRLWLLSPRGDLFLDFRRVDELPPLLAPTADPVRVFDVAWRSFEENFALFELVDIDWRAARRDWRQRAARSDPEQLFALLGEMIEPLNDRHSNIVWPAEGRIAQSGPPSDPFWLDRENEFLGNLAESYLGVPLRTRFADPRLRFGVLPGNVGYLYVESFLDRDPGPAFTQTLDAVLADLADTDGLIVDLRFNPGGVDYNSLAFLERIVTADTRFVYARDRRRTAPLPSAFTPVELQALRPLENPFGQRPLVVLSAQYTASAGEAVLLALFRQPRVVQVGERSRGVFSNLLTRVLPNGWFLTLSNERFFSLEGVSYEQIGIPPAVPVSREDYDLENGVDAAVDRALEVIAAQPRTVAPDASVGAAMTGTWRDPQRDGEGWHLHRISDEAVFVTFYTFDPADRERPLWFVGLGEVSGGRVVVDELVTTSGPRRGIPTAPEDVVEAPWGRLVVTFESCDRAIAETVGPDPARGFVFRLERLTGVPGLGCRPPAAESLQAADLGGAWADPSRPGEGWLLSHARPDLAVVSWFTFDAAGAPSWLIGAGPVLDQNRVVIETMESAFGTRYGYGLHNGEVRVEDAGRLVFDLLGCDDGRVRYRPPQAGAPEAEFPVVRLSRIAGLAPSVACE